MLFLAPFLSIVSPDGFNPALMAEISCACVAPPYASSFNYPLRVHKTLLAIPTRTPGLH